MKQKGAHKLDPDLSRIFTDKLVESANAIIIGLDRHGKILLLNPAAERISGYTLEELSEKDWFETLVPREKYPNVYLEFQRLVEGGLPKYFQNPIQTKSGEERFISWTNSEIKHADEIMGILSFGIDITEQKKAEISLMESEERFRNLMEQSPVSIQIHNLDGTLHQTNYAYEKLYALSKKILAELYEKYNVLQDEQAEKLGLMPYIRKPFVGEVVAFPEYEYHGVDTLKTLDFNKPVSRSCWIKTYGFPIKDKSGNITHAAFIGVEITERKKAEEERIRLFNLSVDLIGIAGFDGYFKQMNPAWELVLGYSIDELLSKKFLDFIHPDDLDSTQTEMEKLAAGQQTSDFENRYLHNDGSIRYISWTATSLPEKGLLYCIGRDITEKKNAENKILQYQQRLKEMASELILTEEKQRREIAKDLHDHVGQLLASSRFQIAALKKSLSDDDQKEKLSHISDILFQAIQDTRTIISDLSLPQLNELGLLPAIEDWLDEHIHEKYGIEVKLLSDQKIYAIDEKVRILTFRSVRELLTNIIKHARASKVILLMKKRNNYLTISISDNGVGFDYKAKELRLTTKGGLGLFSIQERMQDIGGSLEINSEFNKGTKVVLSIPLREQG